MKILQEETLPVKKVNLKSDLVKLLRKLNKNVEIMDRLIGAAEEAYTGEDKSLDFLIDSNGDAISQVGMSIEDFFDGIDVEY